MSSQLLCIPEHSHHTATNTLCSLQYAFNGVTRYCATWWLDPYTNQKINVTDICYDMEWPSGATDPLTGGDIVDKLGCAHYAPSGVNRTAINSTPAGSSSGAPEAGAPVDPITSTAEFVREGLMNTAGRERWNRHQLWQDCKVFTQDGSAARQQCQQEAIGIALGRDVPTLRAMLRVIRVRLRFVHFPRDKVETVWQHCSKGLPRDGRQAPVWIGLGTDSSAVLRLFQPLERALYEAFIFLLMLIDSLRSWFPSRELC